MMIEAVPLDCCQLERWSHLQIFRWLDASQDARTAAAAAVVAVAAAIGYSFASPLLADERGLHVYQAKESCRVTEACQMEAMDEFGFEQQVRVLEAQRKVQRMGKSQHQPEVGYEYGLNEREEHGKQELEGFGPDFPDLLQVNRFRTRWKEGRDRDVHKESVA